MGRKVLLAVAFWLTLWKPWTDAKRALTKLEDSVSEASVQRLYRNIPIGVYASASPYASFSFHVPTFASSPKIPQVGPIKQESVIVENTHGYLKDSYGNKFLESPQTVAYRNTFPQQFVQLHELPAHLAQPLVSAAPSFQYKQVTPHFFGPSQFKVQSLHTASPSTASHYAGYQPQLFSGSLRTLAPVQQQQHQTSNQAVYTDPHVVEQFQNLRNVGKSQRLVEIPRNREITAGPVPQVNQSDKAQLKAAATTTNSNKGNKAVINLVTNAPVPLLDLSLLEPLTFANPLVPQVQHFLPRINSVKYHKLPQLDVNEVKTKMREFVIQNTKSYDSGVVKGVPKENAPRKTETKTQLEHKETHDEHAPPSPTEITSDISNEEPEIVYEIKSPNYKETYKEKVLSYNKETQSEPVHYNYEKKTENQPVHYNYVHTNKEPLQVKSVSYESDDQNPKQLIYHFKAEENGQNKNKQHHNYMHSNKEPLQVKGVSYKNDDQNPKQLIYHFKPEENGQNNNEQHPPRPKESEESSNGPSGDEVPSSQAEQNQGPAYDKATPLHHERPEHKEQEHHSQPDKIIGHNIYQSPPQHYSHVKNAPIENLNVQYQPVIREYEEDIRILSAPKLHANIKVNPSQHIQPGQVALNQNSRESPNRPNDLSHNQPNTHQRAHHYPEQRMYENINKEESPDEVNRNNEEVNEEGEQDEKSEEDFEKGYKDAAYGFPAYETNSRDYEKAIYDPDSYGRPQYHNDYVIEHSPFQQYQVEGDEFPKSTRSNYKDARDKTKEEYYLEYAISKPESLLARHRQKEDYYSNFKKRKPHYLSDERDSETQNEKQSSKYVAAPAFQYQSTPQKQIQTFAKYKVAPFPQVLEYDYSREAPKDNSAHGTRPHQRLKTHTQFVEPQFQYGFEPSTLPRLLDSELAAMASNASPESENPGKRKKIYKENWYIKKTTMNDRKADS